MKRKEIFTLAFATTALAMFVISTPLCASETDDQIESAFKKTYVYRTQLKNEAFKIEANAGVVTLTGTVTEEAQKDLAQETAASLPGVTRVDNQLMIKNEVADKNSDRWIHGKVKLALLFHRHVSFRKTSVEVKDGVVTLKGEASSLAQKELTAEYAGDVEGVKEVKNELTVSATPEPLERTVDEKLDDASVTAQVKIALATHRSTSSVGTKVMVRDGEVTLTGIAKNEAEKALVTKLVTDIHGVTKVRNRMTVEELKTK
jgi:osmotically-inducible protein OsmY